MNPLGGLTIEYTCTIQVVSFKDLISLVQPFSAHLEHNCKNQHTQIFAIQKHLCGHCFICSNVQSELKRNANNWSPLRGSTVP